MIKTLLSILLFEPSGRGYHPGEEDDEINATLWGLHYSDLSDCWNSLIAPLFEYKLFTIYFILGIIGVFITWITEGDFIEKKFPNSNFYKWKEYLNYPAYITFPVRTGLALFGVAYAFVTFLYVVRFAIANWWLIIIGVIVIWLLWWGIESLRDYIRRR